MTIHFYGADEAPYGCFSDFSAHGFELDGHAWPSSEHYFQAQKFTDTRHADLIRPAGSSCTPAPGCAPKPEQPAPSGPCG